MSKVVNKLNFKIIEFANTPDYMDGNWLINPILPNCEKRFWKLDGEIIREMTQEEKNEVIYCTNSTIYLITEKQLIENKNGHDYELNSNAIINPSMPNCDIKYTKVIGGKVVEMIDEEKSIVNQPEIDKINSTTNVYNLYKQALTDLEIIQNISNPTNAQIVWAIKREALILEKLLKFIKLNMM